MLDAGSHPTFEGVEHLAALIALVLQTRHHGGYLQLTGAADGCISLPNLAVVRGSWVRVRVAHDV